MQFAEPRRANWYSSRATAFAANATGRRELQAKALASIGASSAGSGQPQAARLGARRGVRGEAVCKSGWRCSRSAASVAVFSSCCEGSRIRAAVELLRQRFERLLGGVCSWRHAAGKLRH